MKLSKLVIAAMLMGMVLGGKAFAYVDEPNLHAGGCPLLGHVANSAPNRDGFQREAATQEYSGVQSKAKRRVSDRS